MIKDFSVLYAGHVREGDGIGFDGIPANERLAQHTRRIKVGCGFNILPMWHPIRLAEDCAMGDILTGGRVALGVGRGYHTRAVESFGAPMIGGDANRELFEEQFEVLMQACDSEAFSHQGKHYTIPPAIPYRGYDQTEVTLASRPKTQPAAIGQPIVSASDRALDFMAQ